MMGRQELLERVSRYNPASNKELIARAYDYAEEAHSHQTRKSGEKYFIHPMAVADILADLKLDDATIATGLLHDTIEDTSATREEINSLFGDEIGELVEGVTKLDALDLVTKRAEQAENFRKLLIAISSDVRVLLVKLADRLHNMRTMQHMKEEARLRISRETMEIYAPLAGRMGIQWLREELEDLSFRWLYPEANETILARLEKLRVSYKDLIHEVEKELHLKLEEYGIDAVVTSREKKPYSIWRKMENRQIALEQLCDIYGFRVITSSVEECYHVLGVIHTTWQIVPGRFKDYISVPKSNDYKSIHTTIIGPERQRVELQIRTEQMHRIDEYGIAAHALYKDSSRLGEDGKPIRHNMLEDSGSYQWLRQLVDMLREGDNPEEFLEHTRLELFQDQVFTFTPNGGLIVLPHGATAIDFAYSVHTDIGDTCVSCKINGRPMPLMTILKNGDEVEINCTKGRKPPAAWENIVVTGKAKSAIRRANRASIQEQYGRLGHEILMQSFALADLSFSVAALKEKLFRLPQRTVDEVFAAVGRGELKVDLVISALYPDYKVSASRARTSSPRPDHGWLGKAMGLRFRWSKGGQGSGAIPIRGATGDLPIRFAPKGGALPGERIVGIMTPEEGITIYPIHAKALQRFDHQPERWVDVTWDISPESRERFPALISVTTTNQPGSLAKIAQLIGEADANIDKLRMVRRASDFTEMIIGLEVWDIKHLNRIIDGIRGMKIVNRVFRVQS